MPKDVAITLYIIDKQERDNWLSLFEEIQLNGSNGMEQLYAWWLGEQYIIEQSIMELTSLESEEIDE